MKKTIITAMLLITLPLLIGADDSALEKERARVKALDHSIASLCGLEGVGVVIEGLPGETTQAGLTENQLKTDIELKLRLAGIKVLNQEEQLKTPGKPYLYCNVNTIKHDTGLCAYKISLRLYQEMLLLRDSDTLTNMTYTKANGVTWETGAVGVIGINNMEEGIRSSVKDYADSFINDYLTANPKK